MSVLAIPRAFSGRRLYTMRALNHDPLSALTAASRSGERVWLEIGPYRVLLLSGPDDIEEVLVRQNRRFVKGRTLQHARPLLGDGLLTSEGDVWRRDRRLAQPAFHRDRVHAMGQTIVDQTIRAAGRWRDGDVRDMAEEMMRLSFAIATDTLFGAALDDQADTVRANLTTAMRHVNGRVKTLLRLPPWLPTPDMRRFQAAVRELDAVVHHIIRTRQQDGAEHDDVLALLMGASDQEGRGLTERELRDEVMTLLIAGHETTATLMAWTWLLLDRHPSVRRRLDQELRRAPNQAPVTADRVADLPYTRAVISEALRLYPPAWIINRAAIAPFDLIPHKLPAGTQVLISPYVVHRDPRFFPDPEVFSPERWLEDGPKTLHPFAYIPFGGGPRLCIGRPMALLEASLILATLGRSWHFALVPGHPVETEPLITLRPRHGIRMTFRAAAV